jgi:aryl-alcohol dehydrogenase-like predicted oxidoreductase
MKTRKLGWTELDLSTIGLGTWAMGGGNWEYAWGPQDDQESTRAIYRALDLGVNWIDTAPAYGLGHAEEIIGRALHGLHERPLIATKCGLSWNDKGQINGRLKKEAIRAEIEASLKRMRLDVIDLYQIHWPWPDQDIEEAWQVIAAAIKAGKLRYGGVSNFNVEQLKRAQAIHPVASLQPPYSMLVRDIEHELLPFCAANQIGVLAYSPMQKGLLAGKITRERIAKLPPDDHRRNDPQFKEPMLTANLELVQGLHAWAKRTGHSPAHLAIAWVLRRPEVTSAIVGARRPAQIEETAAAADWELTKDDIQAVEDLLAQRQAKFKC